MEAIAAYLDMAGYAVFVWPAYGVTAAVLVVLLAVSLRALKHREREVAGIARRGRKAQA
jgi:heme exporter protein D